ATERLDAHAVERHVLHREPGHARDRRGLARFDCFDIAQHDAAQHARTCLRLTTTPCTPPHREWPASMLDADALHHDTGDVRAVDGLDRHAARLVQIVSVCHARIAPGALP